MPGTVLLVISEGFDDMAFLANQVILEEAGNDVIPTSRDGGAVKGESSSAMTVKFKDALDQNHEYHALIVAGGNNLHSLDGLSAEIQNFLKAEKYVGLIGTGMSLLNRGDYELSKDDKIVESKYCISLADPSNAENFAERFAELIQY